MFLSFIPVVKLESNFLILKWALPHKQDEEFNVRHKPSPHPSLGDLVAWSCARNSKQILLAMEAAAYVEAN